MKEGGDDLFDSFAVGALVFGQQAPISELADLGAVQGHADADEALFSAFAEASGSEGNGGGGKFLHGVGRVSRVERGWNGGAEEA